MNEDRVWYLGKGREGKGPVVYWMSRDQRSRDNWALVHAQKSAIDRKVPVVVVFALAPGFLGATMRHYDFMISGLAQVESTLAELDIPMILLKGDPRDTIPSFLEEIETSYLVTDFDPLKVKRDWKESVLKSSGITLAEVDAHNIVPCWICSGKQEYGAYTIRPKIKKHLPVFLDEPAQATRHPYPWGESIENDWVGALEGLDVDQGVGPVKGIQSGESSALEGLERFLKGGLLHYDEMRNDPNLDGQSGLSPYLHFGQISAQRVALEVSKTPLSDEIKEAFLEELVVRRELSDNYCLYNPLYDSVEGFPEWARRTIEDHREDRREYEYTIEELEAARTHDDLWNAAQMQMVRDGKMHGYMRMYWAKKILEWTTSPEEALDIAIALNDRYELDGRDPNGYTGIAWSLGGVHDRAWAERPIFGKIRYMSQNGARRKFDVDSYIRSHLGQ